MSFALGTIFGAILVLTVEFGLMWFYGKAKELTSDRHHYDYKPYNTYADYSEDLRSRYDSGYRSGYKKGYDDGWNEHESAADEEDETEEEIK